MENQDETKVDSLNLEKTQEDDDERMTPEEWLEHSKRTLEILGINERTFKNAGKCFVMIKLFIFLFINFIAYSKQFSATL